MLPSAQANRYEQSAERAVEAIAAMEKKGRKAVAIQADSANPAAIQCSINMAADALGGFDILVNNAAIALQQERRVHRRGHGRPSGRQRQRTRALDQARRFGASKQALASFISAQPAPTRSWDRPAPSTA